MEHRWKLCPKTEDSEMHLECVACGLIPNPDCHREDICPTARCFGSHELTANILQQALAETSCALHFSPEEVVPWQELLGGLVDSYWRSDSIKIPDIIALWLGDNGDVIAWGTEKVILHHPSTHYLSTMLDGSPEYDHDCYAKEIPRNPIGETEEWGSGQLFWVREPVPQSA